METVEVKELKEKYLAEANTAITFGFIIVTAVMVLMWLFTAVGAFTIDVTICSLCTLVTVAATLLVFWVDKKYGRDNAKVKYFYLTMVCILTGMIASLLTIHAHYLFVLPLLFAIQYRSKKTLWLTYAIDIVVMMVSTAIGFYHGICDLNILLAGNETYAYYEKLFSGDVISLKVSDSIAQTLWFYASFPRAVILLAFTIILLNVVMKIDEDTSAIIKLTQSSETDAKTGLYNKAKFEDMLSDYYPKLRRVGAIFCDLNDLKKTNDTLGHEMGDALIATLAKVVGEICGEDPYKRRAYRVGGDEFVIVLDDPQVGEPDQIINTIYKRLSEIREQGGMSVGVAIGWSVGDGRDARKIVNQADGNMYGNKKAMKAEAAISSEKTSTID